MLICRQWLVKFTIAVGTQEKEIWMLSQAIRGLVSQFSVRQMLGQTVKIENALGQ